MRSTALIRLGLILGGAGGDAEDSQDGSTGDGGGTGDGARGLAPVFVGAEPPQLHLRGMGGQQTSAVTFQLLDRSGLPIANDAVTFSLSRDSGGVALEPDRDGNPTSETVYTDDSGNAMVHLVSGTVQGPIQVIAKHDRTGGEGRSRNIVISTGLPASDRFNISLSDYAPTGAAYTDGIPVEVTIRGADQYGNPAFDGTEVSFRSLESGMIPPSCTLEGGACTVSWTSLNGDNTPWDGRITLLAFTNGAEYFKDENDNGIYDQGEDFTDLSEAWADFDENGQFDPAVDDFVDSESAERGIQGDWDPAENLGQVWDGPCLKSGGCAGASSVTIWEEAVIVLSRSRDDAVLFKYTGTIPRIENCISPGPTREVLNPAPGTTINLQVDDTLPEFFVADSTPRAALPCHILGNSLPGGTRMTFSGENVEIQGKSEWEVLPNTNSATEIGPVTLLPGENTDPGTLKLTVETPDGFTTEFSWPVTK
ncbi:hypothetical protein ACXYTJ_02380 [Gilvimarinus sp. F26214L]|uniref:hypothetical protein n=1 Tax=Gilvimarinus sp. DZF01 TaxID=3461371 RepID=UPI0040467189